MTLRPFVTGLVVAVAVVLPGGRAGATSEVGATESAFTPSEVTVDRGEEVTFRNGSSVPHTVTFDDASVPSKDLLSPGGTHEVTFNSEGTFPFKCLFHPGMSGTVTVKAAASAKPADEPAPASSGDVAASTERARSDPASFPSTGPEASLLPWLAWPVLGLGVFRLWRRR